MLKMLLTAEAWRLGGTVLGDAVVCEQRGPLLARRVTAAVPLSVPRSPSCPPPGTAEKPVTEPCPFGELLAKCPHGLLRSEQSLGLWHQDSHAVAQFSGASAPIYASILN